MKKNLFIFILCLFTLCGCKDKEFRENADKCFGISEELFIKTSKLNSLAAKHSDEYAANCAKAFVNHTPDDEAYDRFCNQVDADVKKSGIATVEDKLIINQQYITDYDGDDTTRKEAIVKLTNDVLAYSDLYTSNNHSMVDRTKKGLTMQASIKKELDDYRKNYIDK